MLKTVTLEDYVYRTVQMVLADPDAQSDVLLDLSKIAEAPADAEGQHAFCEEFVTELRKLHPEWDVKLRKDVPDSVSNLQIGALADSRLWKWIFIDKSSMGA